MHFSFQIKKLTSKNDKQFSNLILLCIYIYYFKMLFFTPPLRQFTMSVYDLDFEFPLKLSQYLALELFLFY